jgi:hypothetical protein
MRDGRRVELSVVLEDFQRIFADRLIAFVAYGRFDEPPAPSLAVVDMLSPEDLAACAHRAARWHEAGAATPLVLPQREFARSADAFPLEYSEMYDTAVVLYGTSPFSMIAGVDARDVRRACEVQVRSHLLHLREDYLECGGRPADVAAFVRESAPAFIVILGRLARLLGQAANTSAELTAFAAGSLGLDARVVGDVVALGDTQQASTVDAVRIFPPYLEALEALAHVVDEWPRAPEDSEVEGQRAPRSP